MSKPYIIIKVNGEQIYHTICDLKISSTLNGILPSASFKIIDNSGSQFAQLKGCLLGSQVCFGLVNGDDVVWTSTIFYIKYVFNGCEIDKSLFSGAVQVYCEHSWLLYADNSQHAYKPQKISEIIKTLSKDFVDSKGKQLNVSLSEDGIQESSEVATISRFKTGESEIEFIKAELLPILQMDGVNGFYFIDHLGNIKLKSFKKLFQEQPKAMITAIESQYKAEDIEKMNEYAKDTLKLNTRYFYSDIDMVVGKTTNYFEELNKSVNFSIEDTTTGNIEITQSNSGPRAKIGIMSNRLPIISEQMKYMGPTKTDSFANVVVSDAVGIECAKQSELNDLFTVHLTLANQIVEDLCVGDTIYLYTKDNNIDEDRKRHWSSGKWLISELSIGKPEPGVEASLFTYLTLIRPTFDRLTEKSTLDDSYLYGVI